MPGYGPSFFSAIEGSAQDAARRVLPLAFDLVNPRSVVDVGCGAGVWLAEAARLGVADHLGVDGYAPPEALHIEPERFVDHDLARPLRLDRRFDLVLCLEVAEHLEPAAAEVLVESLVGLGPAVLFSAAIPHQSGEHHLNEQWPAYWVERFGAHGFDVVDAIRPMIWEDAEIAWWYRQNILLFCEREVFERSPELREARRATRESQLSVVHPDLYLWMTHQRDAARVPSWRRVLQALPLRRRG